MRRIERRMGIVQLDDLPTYVKMLQNDPAELNALCSDFLIGVTAFFREDEAFAFLEKELFPDLVAQHDSETPLRVWVPSCATGEEAYSLAILLLEASSKANKVANIQVFASDINQQSIDIARRGIYPASIAGDVSAERMKQHFVTSDELHYQVSKPLRDSIVFLTQNVISDAPLSKVDLISCRNLLIYLEPDMQQKLISLFHYALVENGLLLLGPAETIGRAVDMFVPVSKKWRIYRRVGSISKKMVSTPFDKVDELSRRRLPEIQPPTPRKSYKELTESILKDYSPAAVLINRRFEILYFSGPVVNFLEFPTGEPSKDLLALARAGLRTRLRSACSKAITQRVEVTDNDAHVQRNGVYIACTITTRPHTGADESEGLVLVILQDCPQKKKTHSQSSRVDSTFETGEQTSDSSKLVQFLEYELKSTREELQNTIEEIESANEELQSSNEELESSKEELQSLNEELTTVNFNLLEKVSELDKSNSEMSNLMGSTEIATLYLDSQLRIKRFTHPTVDLFNLVPTDEGRNIRDFSTQIVDHKLLEDCEGVLKSQKVSESEIYTNDNRCFLRRISPFRTPEHSADGVVVAFIDLTARNRAAAEQRERDACFREIFEHAPTGIAIANLDGLFERCNPAYSTLIGYSAAELQSIHFLSLVHPDDQSRNHEAFEKIQSGQAPFFEIEHRYIHKSGAIVWVRKIVSLLPDGSGKPAHLMALVTDTSTQRRTLDALQQSEERSRAVLKTASDAIITIDNKGLIDSVNQATETIFGYASAEIVGQNISMLMPQPFRNEHDGYIQKYLRTGERRIIGVGREVVCRRKDGSTFPADLAVSHVDQLGLFTGILRDISSHKEMQRHILEIATEEQRRIGLELHDGTQQELTGLSLYASALQETILSASPIDSSESLTWQFEAANFERLKHTALLISKRLTETNQHVRDLAHGIMPVQIDAEGLQSALLELSSSINAKEGINCSFECKGDVSISNNTTATHLYRIAQEAVNNSLRHGSAENIRILLLLQNDQVALEIRDDGVGFDGEAVIGQAAAHRGMGMRTMEYRAGLIGGRVQVQPIAAGGTLVRCEIVKGGIVADG